MKNIITKREKEIFELLIENKSTKDISSILNISEKTVRNHISNVMQKLDVINRSNAIIEYCIYQMFLANGNYLLYDYIFFLEIDLLRSHYII